MKFLPAFLVALLNSMKDPGEIPENVSLGPNTAEEMAQTREAFLVEDNDELVEDVSPDAKFGRMRNEPGRWPIYEGKAYIAYEISPELEPHRGLIMQAMKQFHDRTCVRFHPRENYHGVPSDYVRLVKGSGCSSYVGKIGGKQTLNLGPGCHAISVIVHELAHAVGLHHEQERSDRDKYVYIFKNNIKEKNLGAYEVTHSIPQEVLSSPYNYRSIMHYDSDTFSKDTDNLLTILPKNGLILRGGSQKHGLNDGDVSVINKIYKC